MIRKSIYKLINLINMDQIINSVLFLGIDKDKLKTLVKKYENIKINLNILESCLDKDEIIFCSHLFKYQQKINMNDLIKRLEKI